MLRGLVSNSQRRGERIDPGNAGHVRFRAGSQTAYGSSKVRVIETAASHHERHSASDTQTLASGETLKPRNEGAIVTTVHALYRLVSTGRF